MKEVLKTRLEVEVKNLKQRLHRNLKATLVYKYITEAIENPGKKVYVGKNTGSGSYASSTSEMQKCIDILRTINAPFEYGNDAPRGGRHGDFIIINY